MLVAKWTVVILNYYISTAPFIYTHLARLDLFREHSKGTPSGPATEPALNNTYPLVFDNSLLQNMWQFKVQPILAPSPLLPAPCSQPMGVRGWEQAAPCTS